MTEAITISRETFDHKNEERSIYKTKEGLSEEIVREISRQKQEPEWMLKKRLQGLELFKKAKIPTWGPSLKKLDLNNIIYFNRPDSIKNAQDWEALPQDIRKTFERLGIPEAEKTKLSGVGAQYESDVVYHTIKKELEEKGVIFSDMDVAVKEHPELIKKYFMTTCVPINDHKFIMLHAAVWSGGTFIYVPKGVHVPLHLQAYFRMNARKGGQFEHTLIIIDEGASVQYIEGCSAPQYDVNSLHAGCVEIFVHKNARCRYSSVENWSKNTYNLNTKRAIVDEQGVMEWIGGNMGSGVTMLYPSTVLKGDYSRADHLSIAFAGPGQNQDTGAKIIHIGKKTASTVTAKSISRGDGITTYRGLLKINKSAVGAKSNVACDALLFDKESVTNTYPYIDIKQKNVDIGHEATVGKISDQQIFYLMSRGLSEQQAVQMIVSGFIEPIMKALPLEYAVELNKLIELEMEGSVG